ncbi:hypothetical protein AB205_0196240 [Aquarana catesbeiana]|uniref:glutathione transferase n=1 Tax=Aquarana catesbeiana TaxID=8400 RepID=A0A2G9RG52_AQUCT|nr:hypothetical protein AB205_0196240 [Aquarana catesbeiana]
MPGFTLTYFPVRGRAEPIRLLLADQGAIWTEKEVQIDDWFSGKCELKKTAVRIAGSNKEESARIDMVNDGVEDLRQKFSRFVFIEFETGKEKYLQDLPNQLSPFEKILSNNANGTKFVVGDKISFADYNLLDMIHCHLDLDPKCLASFPLLSAYSQRLDKRPKLSDYLKSEKRNKRPITPKHK